jgi:hypothetical protein
MPRTALVYAASPLVITMMHQCVEKSSSCYAEERALSYNLIHDQLYGFREAVVAFQRREEKPELVSS